MEKLDRKIKQTGESIAAKDLILFTVAMYSAALEEDHPADFRNDVGQVMRDEDDCGFGGELTHHLEESVGGTDVEAGGRLIEDQRLGPMNQCTADQESSPLACGHLVDGPVGKMSDAELMEYLIGPLRHLRCDFVIRPDADAGEEARQNDLAARIGVAEVTGHEVVVNDS